MIGILNSDLGTELSRILEICDLNQTEQQLTDPPRIKGLFIDWIPKARDERAFIQQAALVEYYVKAGIPVVIFDRYTAIDNKEHNWLKKFNVTFFEPCINHRTGFEWCPQWVRPIKLEETPNDREIDLAYEGPLYSEIKSFEKYYLTYASLFPKCKVVYKTDTQIPDFKEEKWREHNLINTKEIDFKQIDFTVVIGNQTDYKTGRIWLNLFDIMSQGCIPLLPIEHRFYIGLFDHLVVRDERDMDYFIMHTTRMIRTTIIEEIFDNAIKRYPEFSSEYVIDRLIKCLRI